VADQGPHPGAQPPCNAAAPDRGQCCIPVGATALEFLRVVFLQPFHGGEFALEAMLAGGAKRRFERCHPARGDFGDRLQVRLAAADRAGIATIDVLRRRLDGVTSETDRDDFKVHVDSASRSRTCISIPEQFERICQGKSETTPIVQQIPRASPHVSPAFHETEGPGRRRAPGSPSWLPIGSVALLKTAMKSPLMPTVAPRKARTAASDGA
jgi:hypothetical protein